MMRIRKWLRNLTFNSTFLSGANSVFLTAIVFMVVHSTYEDRIFDTLVRNTIESSMTQEERILALTDRTYQLMHPRLKVFVPQKSEKGFKDRYLSSADTCLLGGYACGAHTAVLGRSLQRAGFKIRIVQMFVGDVVGHILLEVLVGDRWVVVDPLYNLIFRNRDGRWAGVKDLMNNWDFYKLQVPEGYNPNYRYEKVRYTNWEKIPIVMPALKWVLEVSLGSDRVETISIRPWMLNVYKLYGVILSILYTPIFILTVALLCKKMATARQSA